jgi:hypothetical protein
MPRYLYALDQTRDGTRIAVPSRMFPWTGFGYCLTLLVCSVLWLLTAALSAQDETARVGGDAVLWTLAGLEALMLGWIIAHLCRVGALRHRLARGLRGIEPPPRPYLEGVIARDVALAGRDDRLPAIRFLTGVQAWSGLLLDWFGSILSLQAPTDDGSMFSAARSPRTALLTSAVWVGLWWLVLGGIGVIGAGSSSAAGDAALSPAAWVALVTGCADVICLFWLAFVATASTTSW